MIPRLKPYLNAREALALLHPPVDAVRQFEEKFAQTFGSQDAIVYPYGRSALWAFFKALDIYDAEVIMPSYTCSVVGHAVVLSDNIPVFVDASMEDYNMCLGDIADSITSRTRAIIATHLFGYPMDMARLAGIVTDAESRYGHKIWVISDCAHSFGAEYNGHSVAIAGDASLFGLNISKTITAIFGGVLTTNNPTLAETLRQWRDTHYVLPPTAKALKRRLYLLATYVAFQNTLYGFVYWLQTATPLLSSLTDDYHLDDEIHFPPDYLDQITKVEANVGIQQLDKYDAIIAARRDNAHYYSQALADLDSQHFVLPPLVEGATYSHYVIRVQNRDTWVEYMAKRGVQLGILVEYSMPQLSGYRPYAAGKTYPNARLCSQHMINLPVHAGVTPAQREQVVEALRQGAA